MKLNRRNFLFGSAAAAALAGCATNKTGLRAGIRVPFASHLIFCYKIHYCCGV